MYRKTALLLIAVILSAFILAACGNDGTVSGAPSQATQSDAASSEAISEELSSADPSAEEPSAEEPSTEEPSSEEPSSEEPSSEEPHEPSIVSPETKAGSGVYDFSAFLEGIGYVDSIQFLDKDTVLIIGSVSENEVLYKIVDVYDGGSRTLKSDIEVHYASGFGEKVILIGGSTFAWFPDPENSDECFTYKTSDYSDNITCTSDGFIYTRDNAICFADGKTGTVTRTVPIKGLSDKASYSGISYAGDDNVYLYYSYMDGDNFVSGSAAVSVTDGKATDIPYVGDSGSFADCFDGGAVITYYSRNDIVSVYRNGKTSDISFKSCEEWVEGTSGKMLITSQLHYENYLRLYNLETGECIARLDSPRNSDTAGVASVCANSDGSFVFASFSRYTEEASVPELYLFVTEGKPAEEGNYVPDFNEPEVDYDSLSDNMKKAYDMGKKYGVIIRCGEVAAETHNIYSHDVLPDGEAFGAALVALDNVLAKYPDGFFRELCTGKYNRLIFNCVGNIKKSETGEFAGVGGYFSKDSGRLTAFLTVDCSSTYSLESTFAHELMHAADAYIEYYNFREDNEGYSDWTSYNPEGFSYFSTYESQEDDDAAIIYTFGSFDDKVPVYFVDVYSKTYAVEDRARIFENAFVHGEGFLENSKPTKALREKNIIAKMNYIFETYREVFATVRNADSVFWEQNNK